MGCRRMALGRRNGIMWVYEKRLEFPVNIKNPDPKAAMIIISQYGGALCRKVYGYFFSDSVSTQKLT